MAVGTLNVAVTASTRQAIAEINALRGTVKGLEMTIAGTKRTMGSLTIPEIGRTFYFPKEEMRGALTQTELFRSATVDLSADVTRYNVLAVKQTGLIKGMGSELKAATRYAMSAVKVAGAVAATFYVFFSAAKRVSEYAQGIRSLSDDYKKLKTSAASAMEAVFDPRLHATKLAKADAQERMKVEAAAKAEAKAKIDAEIAARTRAGGLDILEAKGFNVDRQFEEDRADRGLTQALAWQRMREAAVAAESAQAAKKLASEKQLEAIREQNRKWEEGEQRRRENQLQDEKTIADLRRNVAEFWMSDVERERGALLRTLEDPRLRRQATDLFTVQDAQQSVQRDAERRKNMRALLSESGSQSLSATGADSSEGFAQRVRFQNTRGVNKIAEKQLSTQQKMEGHLSKLAARPVADISLANFSAG